MNPLARGDIVTVALPEDYGKPCPAVVVQSNLLDEILSFIGCHTTSTGVDALGRTSWIMVEKVATTRLLKVRKQIGALTKERVAKLDELLSIVLGLAHGT